MMRTRKIIRSCCARSLSNRASIFRALRRVFSTHALSQRRDPDRHVRVEV